MLFLVAAARSRPSVCVGVAIDSIDSVDPIVVADSIDSVVVAESVDVVDSDSVDGWTSVWSSSSLWWSSTRGRRGLVCGVSVGKAVRSERSLSVDEIEVVGCALRRCRCSSSFGG